MIVKSRQLSGKQLQTKIQEQKSESPSPNCMESRLIRNEKPILANSSLADETVQDFPILVFPTTKDKYITTKILEDGSYEPEMAKFISHALKVDVNNTNEMWAVDIGSNVGFHSLHMASRGATVISFEAAPDTAALFKCSVELNNFNGVSDSNNGSSRSSSRRTRKGSVTVIQAGASDVNAVGIMSRHALSPGMTTFSSKSSYPLKRMETNGGTTGESQKGDAEDDAIQLVRVEDILIQQNVPQMDSTKLRLLKVDVEGYELRAFRGLNLTRYPFQYVAFEFFPRMLRDAGSDPADLLIDVYAKYDCSLDYFEEPSSILKQSTREELNKWINGIYSHVNIFCHLKLNE